MCKQKNCCYYFCCKKGNGGGMEAIQQNIKKAVFPGFVGLLAIKLSKGSVDGPEYKKIKKKIENCVIQGNDEEVLQLIHEEQRRFNQCCVL